MGRKLLWASLSLAPVPILLRYAFHAGEVTLFVLAAAALVPLAWLIGEATEHAGEHTGPGVGGFLNASFGNAPELIIALFAVADGLPEVVRGSLGGSVIGNVLLVLGFALLLGGEGELDRRSLASQLGLVLLAGLLFLLPSVPGFHGDPERRSLALLTLPVALGLLLLYLAATTVSLRRHRRLHAASEALGGPGWTLGAALAALAIATGLTAVVSEILVHSLRGFANSAGLSTFFIAVIVVAIVGNAAEHGGAVVIAYRGKIKLATEIAVSSGAQVALLVTPAVALLSWAISPALPLAFRWQELLVLAGAPVAAGLVIADGRSKRWEGALLIASYAGIAIWFGFVGDR